MSCDSRAYSALACSRFSTCSRTYVSWRLCSESYRARSTATAFSMSSPSAAALSWNWLSFMCNAYSLAFFTSSSFFSIAASRRSDSSMSSRSTSATSTL